MSAIAFRRPSLSGSSLAAVRRYWPELVWVAFCALNVGAIILVPSGETIPFHLIWVSLTLVYGLRAWSIRPTAITLGAVILLTGVALAWALVDTGAGFDEIAEVPLMAAMFVVVMLHVYRRQAALEEIQRLADRERRLIERERNLIHDASHELRTPITVARGHAELIRQTASGQAAADAEIILDELDRLSRIAERLLLLAAAEHSDFLNLAPVELERLVVETVNRWTPAAARRWHFECPPDVVLVGDGSRIATMLDALVENAVEHTEDGDTIAIIARSVDGMALIEVADSGVGIPTRHLDRIFDRFSRADEGRRRQNGGTGLGLAIVKAIVQAHGGSVAVQSEVGKGTTFSLLLPTVVHERSTKRRQEGSAASLPANRDP